MRTLITLTFLISAALIATSAQALPSERVEQLYKVNSCGTVNVVTQDGTCPGGCSGITVILLGHGTCRATDAAPGENGGTGCSGTTIIIGGQGNCIGGDGGTGGGDGGDGCEGATVNVGRDNCIGGDGGDGGDGMRLPTTTPPYVRLDCSAEDEGGAPTCRVSYFLVWKACGAATIRLEVPDPLLGDGGNGGQDCSDESPIRLLQTHLPDLAWIPQVRCAIDSAGESYCKESMTGVCVWNGPEAGPSGSGSTPCGEASRGGSGFPADAQRTPIASPGV